MKLEIPEVEYPYIIHNNQFHYEWCCDCGLKHTIFYQFIRGATPDDDIVKAYAVRDDWATDAFKELKRLRKAEKKKKCAK